MIAARSAPKEPQSKPSPHVGGQSRLMGVVIADVLAHPPADVPRKSPRTPKKTARAR